MEYVISVFLGAYLVAIGIISLIRINKDYKDGEK